MKKALLLTLAVSLAATTVLRAEEAAPAETKTMAAVAKNDAPGSLKQGNQLLDEGKFAEAAAYFEGIGEQSSSKREPWRLNNWAFALLEDGKYEKCIEVAQKAVDGNPGMESAWNKLAAAYARNGQRDEAVKKYEEAIEAVKKENGDTSKLESNMAALLQVIEDGKPKKVKEAEAKAKAEAEAAAAKAAEATK